MASFAARGAHAIETHPVNLTDALLLAERDRLCIYDAAYPWLARHLSAPLVTLDRRLEQAAAAP